MIEKKVVILGIAVVALIIASFAIHMLYYAPLVDDLTSMVKTQQDELVSMDAQIANLTSKVDTQLAQLESKDAQITSLDSQVASLQSQITDLQSQITNLQSSLSSSNAENSQLQDQIENLQSQILDYAALVAQLQGPTGILPTYMDLGWVGPDLNNGDYFLQLSLKNTGDVPINQIFVTINSVQLSMTFTYLNNTVSPGNPLPPYETATGIQDATPPVTHPETYPLLIQGVASNGTIYTYQTTITSHV
jgi:archaellum component FlaC